MDVYSVIAQLQEWLAPADYLLRWLSLHTYSHYYLLAAATLYWSGYTAIGARLAFGTLLSTLTFGSCRQFFASPRPYWSHPELFLGVTEKAFGMPSGHSQNAVVFWGLLARSLRQQTALLLCTLLIACIAVSRVYLGVHYPSQVITGLTVGLLLLTALTTLEKPCLKILHSKPVWARVTITLLFCSLPLLVTLFLREGLQMGSGNGPALPYKRLLLYTGLFTGLCFGLLMPLNSRTACLRLFLSRAIPGAVSTIVFWKLLPLLPALKEAPAISYLSHWLAGLLLTFWATGLWPLLHSRLFPD